MADELDPECPMVQPKINQSIIYIYIFKKIISNIIEIKKNKGSAGDPGTSEIAVSESVRTVLASLNATPTVGVRIAL